MQEKLKIEIVNMKQGDIYFVNFEPQVGTEIMKTRPAIIVSDERAFSHLKVRLVVPIRHFKQEFAGNFIMPTLNPTKENKLTKKSVADCFQIKSLDLARFTKKSGEISQQELDEIKEAIALCINL